MCDDPDKNISKFACVVVGNSSFYDDTLYGSLRPAVPILVSLLMKETEEKARSNAIAALGNLARNSATLDREFVVLSAPVHLLNLLTTDKSLAVKKVVVLAIHNMLGLPESRKMLLGQNVGAML